MGKRRAAKQPEAKPTAGGMLSATSSQHNEKLLSTWTQREIQSKLQCSPDEAQMATASILSMSPKQLREWCTNLLSETEKRIDEDRRFYSVFMDKKEELGLLSNDPPKVTEADTVSEVGSVASASTTASSFKGKRSQKYNKQVDLSKTKEGLDALIPISQECNCEARKHKLLTNCQRCGKIVCEQEGWGRCYFCGAELRRDSKPVLGKKDEETDEAYLSREREFLKAVSQRDKLLRFQEERSKRTTIVDDQEDYYSSSNPWLDKDERKIARQREDREKEDRQARHKRGGAYMAHIDIFNKNVEVLTEKDLQRQRKMEEIEKKKQDEAAEERRVESMFEKRKREQKETEENASNIMVSHNVVYDENIAAELQEVEEEDDEGNTVHTLRVMRCPDSKPMHFDSTAMLQTWVVDKLVNDFGFNPDDAEKDASSLARMTNMTAVRMWAKVHLDEKGIQNNFPKEYEMESHRVQMSQNRDTVQTSAEKVAHDSRKYANPRGTGRIQTDWDELDEEHAEPVQKMLAKKKKPWVMINSTLASKLDRKLGLKESGSAMCMSMHQPWASLLVCGIKKHEGRVWGTDFRGRLFIHAASHQPTEDDIDTVESFYKERGATVFPTHYPTSVLLGCVTVTDVLHFEEYKKKIPPKDQESSSEYVFVCHNPQMLVLPLPMDGNHKIFPLDKGVLQAVKLQSGNRAEI
eukprot:TRINITY_DN13416_c0_g1_i1.p1 TRINITY_DN13416_c0_g1~~TRINITY_DN13416_c0_g1_i1.p1  ORF type:complete len:693 (+),score=363.46 TRINITY_DN13416_c0_g1_i1:78-2156(+)